MRTFARTRHQPPKPVSSNRFRSNTAISGSNPRSDSILHLQRTIGNQAVLRMVLANAEEANVSSASAASRRFVHDVSRIPIHPPAEGAIPPKLAIDEPSDAYEQEADRLADRVMHMSEPKLPHADPSGGGCPAGQTNRPVQAPERLPAERDRAGAPGRIAAPSIVHEVLASPGQPLDPSTRVLMERHLGHDFRRVRVHADATAAESARAIDALAYAAGPDLVFGAGQYAPHTTAGRALLAHEVAHVIQRQAGGVIRRRPTPQAPQAEEDDARLRELAAEPGLAHREWKRLTSPERMAVIVHMTNRYGRDFAQSFLWYTEHPIETSTVVSNRSPEHTPAWFQARGYQLWQTSLGAAPGQVMEFWVHPSGAEILEIRDGQTGRATTTVPPEPPPKVDCAPLADVTSSILRDTIRGETAEQADLTGEKAQLERLNKTTDDYRQRYDAYMEALQAMKAHVDTTVDDIELMRQQLQEMGCTVPSTIDLGLQELLDLQIWADIESSPFGTQFLQPLHVSGPKGP